MRKVIFLIWACLIMAGCQESLILTIEKTQVDSGPVEKQEGMQRMVLSSPDEVKYMISLIENGIDPGTRSHMSDNDSLFVSLVEANRRKVLSSLTPAQLEEIENDEEGLEYCPSDSVIADIHFAMLLNANRELQVGATVYKYYANGVAFTHQNYADELRSIDAEVAQIDVTDDNVGTIINVTPNICFSPANYGRVNFSYATDRDLEPIGGGLGGGGGSGGGGNSGDNSGSEETLLTGTTTDSGILLSNGVVIPASDIREAHYKEDSNDNQQDGSWLHRTWSGIWGRNIVAIKNFSDSRKLTMNFYDQNYIVYANIGTKLKMQKKRFLIWWNIKSQNMVQGWDAVTVRYKMPKPVPPEDFSVPGLKNPTVTTYQKFPFSNENKVLFKIPFVNYNFKAKNLNEAFKAAAEAAFNGASQWAKNKGVSSDKIGLTAFNDKYAYVIHGPYSCGGINKKSMESKFHAQWLSGTCEFQFSVGSSFTAKLLNLNFDDGVELYSGRVFGAIKYKGKWLGAKITLYPPDDE